MGRRGGRRPLMPPAADGDMEPLSVGDNGDHRKRWRRAPRRADGDPKQPEGGDQPAETDVRRLEELPGGDW